MTSVFLASVYLTITGLVALGLLALLRSRIALSWYFAFTYTFTFLAVLSALCGLVSGVLLLIGGAS